jgi:isopenicillin N synthase-like dioxygenase
MNGSAVERGCFVECLREACRDAGTFYLINHIVPPDLCTKVLQAACAFFALSDEDKAGIEIRMSEHFRGYSRMSNERDWREQVHFGPEELAITGGSDAPAYWRLQGPNLWPVKLGADWQRIMLSFMSTTGALGRRLLSALAIALELPEGYFDRLAEDVPYLLMKLICYYPQPLNQASRNGVAAHCDWSWLTFLLQNEAGLQVQRRNGQWLDVPPLPGALVVNIGELAEIVSGGYFYATPHRVCNISSDKPRISIPVFINPNLNAVITPMPSTTTNFMVRDITPHIHRVRDPSKAVMPFIFGESEWQRKGLGRWCYETTCHS